MTNKEINNQIELHQSYINQACDVLTRSFTTDTYQYCSERIEENKAAIKRLKAEKRINFIKQFIPNFIKGFVLGK